MGRPQKGDKPTGKAILMEWFSESDLIRFWSFVAKTDTCWNWTGHCVRRGYGQFRLHEKSLKAHRISYLLAHGELPDRVFILHRCDNPTCVNPDHLFLGDHDINMKDRREKGRYACGEEHWTHTNPASLPRGEKAAAAKIGEPEFLKIREIYAVGSISQEAIGKMFGIRQTQVSRIIRGESWRHLINQ